jgi:ribokinase
MEAPAIVCLGAVNVDLLYRVEDLAPFRKAFPPLSRGGEVAISRAQEQALQELLPRHARFRVRQGGGQAANTAWALARLGLPVALVGRVGTDADGVFLTAGLSGVNLDYLCRAGESGRAYILVEADGERTILVAPNTNDELRETDIPLEMLARAGYLHLTSFVGDGPLKVQQEMARRLKGGPAISLDPGELYARRGWRTLRHLLSATETLLVTEAEWDLLGGLGEGRPEWAPPVVVIKRGARGARLLTREGWRDFPAEAPGNIVDTLGAGDVFAAGFLAGRLRELDLPGSVRLAVRAAGLSLTGAGRERYPDREFLENQVAELGQAS